MPLRYARLFHEIYPFWAKSDFASHSIVSSARNRILKADLSCLHFSRSFARECRKTGVRHDPCVIDTFIAAVRFAEGGPPVPWWRYTAERKQALVMRAALPAAGALAKAGSARRKART